jgi:uncharacterized protein YkwD
MKTKNREIRTIWLLGATLAALAGCDGIPNLLRTEPPAPLAILKPELSSWVEDDFPREAAPRDAVERAIFDQINLDRAKEGIAPVLWDEKASSLARGYTRQQIAERTVGHYLLDGVPPYARLSRRGDFGANSENTTAFMTTADRLWDLPKDLALRGEREMVQENPPNDGHRRTILDPFATHVGVGWALEKGDFRMAEEFTTRGFDWLRVARAGQEGSSIEVKGKALGGRSLDFVSVAWQPVPEPLTREQIISRHSYSYPAPRYALMPAASRSSVVGLQTFHCLVPSLHGRFSFRYEIDQPGLWTFVLYFQEKGRGHSYLGGSFSVWVG